MLVRVQNEAGLSGAERRLVEWLGSWVDRYALPGVAMVNCNVPGPNGAARQVDAVIWSPHGCVVVEVKGFTRRQDGVLRVPLNGEWTVDGQPAALHTSGEANPVEQLRTNLYAVKNGLETAGVDPGFVSGLVVVLPARGARLDLAGAVLPTGIEVVLADGQKTLRRYFHQLAKHRAFWAADDVAAAFTALDLGGFLPERAELLAHGIPDRITRDPQPRAAAPDDPGGKRFRRTSPTPVTPPGSAPPKPPKTPKPPQSPRSPKLSRSATARPRSGRARRSRATPPRHQGTPAWSARLKSDAARTALITLLALVALAGAVWLLLTVRATFHPGALNAW
ncbi:nuclease-related domain-containing protein [Saccharothrix lopnurensis]|uniref:Nuclease-related domain-containing protein n=1 Tax=Saccharothrix lopnurensis TaxID=1670621 RepID=A0ABW1NY17_9PSEU